VLLFARKGKGLCFEPRRSLASAEGRPIPVILVIDDDAAVRHSLRTLLEEAGHTVTEAADGAAGLVRLQAVPPDLVLCDVFMPTDGLETIHKLRRLRPEAPVIAMSGGSAMFGDFLPVAKAMGAADTLHKPFDPDRLLKAIARLLPAG
jgi:two-component system chemotaxis response regulator CheY